MTVSDITRTRFPFLTSLEGRFDAEPRRVLLRVATDLFVNDPAPSREAIAEFEKAALKLLSDRDAATRLVVARKIAPRIDTPPAVLAAIIERGHDAALFVLERAVAAPRPLLLAAAGGDEAAACAVARRRDLDDEIVGVLARRPVREIALALAMNLAAPLAPERFALLAERARDDKELAAALLARPAAPLDQAPLFMFASLEQRQAILLAAQRAELGRLPGQSTWRQPDDAVRRLESYALARQPDLLIETLAEALGCEAAFARRIVDEPSGEPLAVALAELAASQEASMRILLLGHSPLNLDTMRLGALTRLKEGLRPAAARRVISAMIGAARRRPVAAKPALDPSSIASNRTTSAPAGRLSVEAPQGLKRRRAAQIVVGGRVVREF
jgi:uncharacterized protein (DUF2336 family)